MARRNVAAIDVLAVSLSPVSSEVSGDEAAICFLIPPYMDDGE
jgi:hypothetical protein